jgi:hypothetical protein
MDMLSQIISRFFADRIFGKKLSESCYKSEKADESGIVRI